RDRYAERSAGAGRDGSPGLDRAGRRGSGAVERVDALLDADRRQRAWIQLARHRRSVAPPGLTLALGVIAGRSSPPWRRLAPLRTPAPRGGAPRLANAPGRFSPRLVPACSVEVYSDHGGRGRPTTMISPRSALKGVAAALVAPWHLEGERLERLLEPSAGGAYRASDGAAHPALEDGADRAAEDAAHHASDGAAARRRESADCRAAVRWANRALRILARLPASPWRNTCLYRATAGCLALRWLGEPASLVIGARRD